MTIVRGRAAERQGRLFDNSRRPGTLPEEVQLSGSIRESSGLPQQRIFVVTSAVVPGLTQINQNLQVAERGELRYPWVNLVDLRVAKSFRVGGAKIEPTVDLYNVFNNNAVTNAVTTIGSSPPRRPSSWDGCCAWAGGLRSKSSRRRAADEMIQTGRRWQG